MSRLGVESDNNSVVSVAVVETIERTSSMRGALVGELLRGHAPRLPCVGAVNSSLRRLRIVRYGVRLVVSRLIAQADATSGVSPVTERPFTGKYHRNVVCISSSNNILIVDGAARLNDRPNARLGCFLETVGKREERIRGHN